jgi:ferrous iron transport protein A
MESVKFLSDLKPRERGRVAKIGGGDLKRKLIDMGVLPGSEVAILRVAPLGDPIEIKIRGYNLSLRKKEAEQIQVEVFR